MLALCLSPCFIALLYMLGLDVDNELRNPAGDFGTVFYRANKIEGQFLCTGSYSEAHGHLKYRFFSLSNHILHEGNLSA